MDRRSFIIAASAAAYAAQAAAQTPAQGGPDLRPIQPENDLERSFVAALASEEQRPAFRRLLLQSQVALALASTASDAGPLLRPLDGGGRAGFIFTSASRINSVMGPTAPRAMIAGRLALERLRGNFAILNLSLSPMLRLEPPDVARLLLMAS